MFKCIHSQTGEEIVILREEWRGRLDVLRGMARQEHLICQGCRQAVRVKRGSTRRRAHFAHVHLQGCSCGSLSPEILEARAVLYEWLEAQFPGKVSLEVDLSGVTLPGMALPRPIDCIVQADGVRFAYWIIPALLKQEARLGLKAAFEQVGMPVVWVLLARLQHVDVRHANHLHLSPSERDFLKHTPYDEAIQTAYHYFQEFGQSLHYLDAERGRLTTWRGLEKVHDPQVYAGRVTVSPLAQVTAAPDGEFIHPGEALLVRRVQQQRQRAELERERLESAQRQRQERLQRWRNPSSKETTQGNPAAPQPPPEAVCVFCGQKTTDWWTIWNETDGKKCKCRSCLEKGIA
jgi:hypothetical protein